MEQVDLTQLSTTSLIILLKTLQKRFDACKNDDDIVSIYVEHFRTMAELKRRGLTDEQIEWLLANDPSPS